MKYCCSKLRDEIESEERFVYKGKKCIKYFSSVRMFAIIIDEEQKIYQPMDYCPFCGKKFPNDLNDEYWDTIIKEVGAEYYPTDENYDKNKPLPGEFKTDEWWKKRGL